MRYFFALVVHLGIGWGAGVSVAELPRVPGDQMTAAQIEQGASAVHPATLYILADRLFKGGRQDDGVFWLYAGQLRYRFYLQANPALPPSGDPALFSSLSEVIGTRINRYAFEDVSKLVGILERVGEWDERTPNGFTSKETHHATWLDVRDGFKKFIEDVKGSRGASPLQSSAPDLGGKTLSR